MSKLKTGRRASLDERAQDATLVLDLLAGEVHWLLRLVKHHRAEEANAREHGEMQLARQISLNTDRLELKLRVHGLQLREHVAALSLSNAQRSKASRPRPSRRSGIRRRIDEMMRKEHNAGTEFKVFMRRWEADAIDGLRLRESETRVYQIDDENAVSSPQTYTLGTLKKLYSECGSI